MTTAEGRKRGGQPKPAEERKRNNLTFRARDELRESIRDAAEGSGRSISEEIEYRLELSVARRDELEHRWGKDMLRIAEGMAASLSMIEQVADKSWHQDDKLTDLFKITASQVIQNYRDRMLNVTYDLPQGAVSLEELTPEDQAQWFARLGGTSPPRKRRPPVEVVITDE